MSDALVISVEMLFICSTCWLSRFPYHKDPKLKFVKKIFLDDVYLFMPKFYYKPYKLTVYLKLSVVFFAAIYINFECMRANKPACRTVM